MLDAESQAGVPTISEEVQVERARFETESDSQTPAKEFSEHGTQPDRHDPQAEETQTERRSDSSSESADELSQGAGNEKDKVPGAPVVKDSEDPEMNGKSPKDGFFYYVCFLIMEQD